MNMDISNIISDAVTEVMKAFPVIIVRKSLNELSLNVRKPCPRYTTSSSSVTYVILFVK